MGTGDDRPPSINNAVSGVGGWRAAIGAAQKIDDQSIRDGAQRTWYSVTFPSTKRLELTRLGMIIHAKNARLFDASAAYMGQIVKSRNAIRTGVFMCANASFNSKSSPRPISSECSSG